MLNNTWYIYSLSSPVFFSLCSPLCLWHSPHSPLFLSCLPAPTRLPLSLFLCAHITVVVTSHCVFLSLHDCSYPPPNTLLLPKAQPCPGLCCCNYADKLFGHSFGFDSFFSHSPSPPFRHGSVQCKLRWTHKRSNIHRIHTHALFTQVPALLIVLSAKLKDSFGNMT